MIGRNHWEGTMNTSRRLRQWAGYALLGACCGIAADDLTGANQLICASGIVNVCDDAGDCATTPPRDVNVPQFIEIDIKKKRLATTEASGENRATNISSLERTNGSIYLQGV